ncbi:FGGY-family carbohydrate kinase [Escherichia coli]
MSVMLSAASCLDWVAKLTGLCNVPALIAAAQQADESASQFGFCLIFPASVHHTIIPRRRSGLTHQHRPNELARAVLEGVGYALADGMDVVHACGIKPQSVTLIGGGARSEYWRQMLADISGRRLDYPYGGGCGASTGHSKAGADCGESREIAH